MRMKQYDVVIVGGLRCHDMRRRPWQLKLGLWQYALPRLAATDQVILRRPT